MPGSAAVGFAITHSTTNTTAFAVEYDFFDTTELSKQNGIEMHWMSAISQSSMHRIWLKTAW